MFFFAVLAATGVLQFPASSKTHFASHPLSIVENTIPLGGVESCRQSLIDKGPRSSRRDVARSVVS